VQEEVDPLPLRLEWMDPADLRANPANWRTHPPGQRLALSAAMKEVGWAGALLYNERTKRLIDGHLRKEVAPGPVPVLVGSWTEDQERLILATLDPLAAAAEADGAALAALLASVKTDDEHLAALLAGLADDNPAPDPPAEGGGGGDDFDATPDDAGPCRVSPGDLWFIDGGRHRLLCGDSTKAEDVARLTGGDKPFLMVTDPPYGVEYDPEWREDVGEYGGVSLGKVVNDDRVDWSAAFRLCHAPVAYVWHASWFIADTQRALVDVGYLPRSQVIWAKPHASFGRGHYHWQHEPCWYAVRKGATANWTGDRCQTTLWEIAGLNPMGRSRDSADVPTGHGTQKPLECMARPIRNHGAEGDIVYDPFIGSGTTLVAAHRLGRRCLGVEIEPRYAEVVLRRAEAEGLSVEKSDGRK
jgi:DNA modification methylase